MPFIELHAGIANLSDSPDIAFQYQEDGTPWPSVAAAHYGVPADYIADGKIRFINFGDGRGKVEYWYHGGKTIDDLKPRYENLESADAFLTAIQTESAAAVAAKNESETIKNQILEISMDGTNYLGIWDAFANLPDISVVTPAGSNYLIGKSGTQNFYGDPVLYEKGRRIISNGVQYEQGPAVEPSDGTVTRPKLSDDLNNVVGEEFPFAAINGKQIFRSFRDINLDVVWAVFKDGTTTHDADITLAIGNGFVLQKVGRAYVLKYGSVEGKAPLGSGVIENEENLFVNGKRALSATKDSTGSVLDALFADGTGLRDITVSLGVKNGLTISKSGFGYTINNGSIEGAAPFGAGVVEKEDNVFVQGKRALNVVRDSNGDVVEASFADGTTFGISTSIDLEVSAARGLKADLSSRISGLSTNRGIPTTPIWGAEFLTNWLSWTTNQVTPFDWIGIGDSFTQGSYYFGPLRTRLIADGYANGGAGWCGFNRWGEITGSINQAVNSALVVSYTLADWSRNTTGNMGIDGYIASLIANTSLTLTANEATDSVTLVYEKHAGAGDFRWRIGAGSWTTVSAANATQTIGTLLIDTSALGTAFTIQIEALAIGLIFCGAIAKKAGNVLRMHKCGISGGTASLFGAHALWATSAALTTPKGAIIMFGTNEHASNVVPAVFKANVLNIITKLRTIDPAIDILLGAPTFTQYESELPRTYSLRDYAQALFELAQEQRCAFVNHGLALGVFSQSQIDAGFVNSDRVHPGTKGGHLIANNFYKTVKK